MIPVVRFSDASAVGLNLAAMVSPMTTDQMTNIPTTFCPVSQATNGNEMRPISIARARLRTSTSGTTINPRTMASYSR